MGTSAFPCFTSPQGISLRPLRSRSHGVVDLGSGGSCLRHPVALALSASGRRCVDHTPPARTAGRRGLGARGFAPAFGPRRPGPGPAPLTMPRGDHASRSDPAYGPMHRTDPDSPPLIPTTRPAPGGRRHCPQARTPGAATDQQTLCAPQAGARRLGLRRIMRAVVGGSWVAGVIDSVTLGSHFGGSLEDHGPNVVL
jgi:hypothetical protein